MLTEEQIILIQENQSKAIQAKRLCNEQLQLIYQNNWFNMWVPKQLNGLELPLPTGLNLIEELAYWDGGLAWTITLCAGANMFAGFINNHNAQEMWQNHLICLGGSGKVGGKAVVDGDDYILTGLWNYATGAPHLTHFTLNAEIVQDGQLLKSETDEPLIYSFFVPRDKVLIHYDWDTFGLECTASHSFSIDQVRIPKENAFVLDPAHKEINNPLYDIPFLPFAELTLLMNYVGMFKRFLDLTEKYYFEKSKDLNWADKFSKIRFRESDQIRLAFDLKLAEINNLMLRLWESVVEQQEIEEVLLKRVAEDTRSLVKEIRGWAVVLFPNLGIKAAQRENELNIVFRNLFTATQHSLLHNS